MNGIYLFRMQRLLFVSLRLIRHCRIQKTYCGQNLPDISQTAIMKSRRKKNCKNIVQCHFPL